jgi:hypothetical protein
MEANAPRARCAGTKILLADDRDLHHAAFFGGALNAPACLRAPILASS